MPPSCCSSANFTCPNLELNPTAVLPQVDPCQAATQLILKTSDGVWLLLCSPGGHSACSCSLSGSGCCFPVGRGTACLLPGKVLFSSDSENVSPAFSAGWLPLRRGNGMSLVTTDRRESSGTRPTMAGLWKLIQKRKVWNLAMGSSCVHHNLLPCNLLSCVCLLFPTHYFDNSIVNEYT